MLDVGISGCAPGIHLNALGRTEVQKLAKRLEGRGLDVLFTSPIERAHETGTILASALGVPLEVHADLCELEFGRWTGCTFDELRGDPHWTRFNTFRSGTRIPEGELMLETQVRGVRAVLALREQHPNQTLGLVTHGDVIKCVLVYFLGMPLDLHGRLEIAPASVSTLELGDDYAKLVGLNETGFTV
jgi:broad specificity phosphatase PhoE